MKQNFDVFTMAARLSRFHNGRVGLRSAFTMAEILLSLTIIGVVAAEFDRQHQRTYMEHAAKSALRPYVTGNSAHAGT